MSQKKRGFLGGLTIEPGRKGGPESETVSVAAEQGLGRDRAGTTAGAAVRGEARPTKRGVPTVMLDPTFCRPWKLADRFEEGFDPKAIEDLVAEFKTVGQHTPVKARRIQGAAAGEPQFEIIAGRRRLEAAKLAGVQLMAILEEETFDDRAAFEAMISENDARKDITEFERAISFAMALQQGIYRGADELVESCSSDAGRKRYTRATVSMMLTAATLKDDPVVWPLLKGRRDIPLRPAYELARRLAGDAKAHEVVAVRVKNLGPAEARGMPPQVLIKDLLAALERSKKAASQKGAGDNAVAIAGFKDPLLWRKKGDKVLIELPATALGDKAAVTAALRSAIDQAAG